ncbi:hypothetical protein CR513_28555, partial [Mucuna pruriens]
MLHPKKKKSLRTTWEDLDNNSSLEDDEKAKHMSHEPENSKDVEARCILVRRFKSQFCDSRHDNLYRIDIEDLSNQKRFLGKPIFFVMHVRKENKSKVLLYKKIPTRTLSLEGKKYGFVIIDDYSRFIWVYFLSHKHESHEVFEIFYKRVQNEKGICIFVIRSDHGKGFGNFEFKILCEKNEATMKNRALVGKVDDDFFIITTYVLAITTGCKDLCF